MSYIWVVCTEFWFPPVCSAFYMYRCPFHVLKLCTRTLVIFTNYLLVLFTSKYRQKLYVNILTLYSAITVLDKGISNLAATWLWNSNWLWIRIQILTKWKIFRLKSPYIYTNRKVDALLHFFLQNLSCALRTAVRAQCFLVYVTVLRTPPADQLTTELDQIHV